MNHEQQEIADQVRSGQYYAEARQWYQALYIGPISERAFFLLVAVLAGLIALVGLVALLSFMPITSRPALLISTPEIERVSPSITRLRGGQQSLGDAMERFFLQEYVAQREGYEASSYAAGFAFVRAHSDPTAFAAYEALYGPANPRSPASILGEAGRRLVRIQSISLRDTAEPKQATVKFSTELEGVGTQAKTQWTAVLGYYYSPVRTTEEADPETGEEHLVVEDPQFKVVDYAVTQTP